MNRIKLKKEHRNYQINFIGLPCCEEFDRAVLEGRESKCDCYKKRLNEFKQNE
jgi:hypothetical protein